jgi:phosphate transport system permease protein
MYKTSRNRYIDRGFQFLGLATVIFSLLMLAFFIFYLLYLGASRINWAFLTNLPSRFPAKAGILTAWTGTVWIFVLTAFCAIPIGISAGIYLEEYAKKTRLANILEINISNLAGVPSIIFGLFGLEIFGRLFGLGRSVLAGSLTLALLILPIIIVATKESLRAVPQSLKDAAYGLGASKWQTIRTQVLPTSYSGIMTGIVLALSRTIGETAPLIVVGALAYIPFVAKSPMDDFTVLPMQIFNWISRPQHSFIVNAAAAIIVLLVIVIILNGIAVVIRNIASRRMDW